MSRGISTLLATIFVGSATVISWTGASAQTVAGAEACRPGLGRDGSVVIRTYCGPAKATIHVDGTTINFSNGRCTRGQAFEVHIGTLEYSYRAPRHSYFRIAVAAYDDGRYGADRYTRVFGGYAYAGKVRAFGRLVLTLRGNLTRGTFTALVSGGGHATGSFSCR